MLGCSPLPPLSGRAFVIRVPLVASGLTPLVASVCLTALTLGAQTPPPLRNAAALELRVEDENTQPSLRISVPGVSDGDHAIEVLFPEHVTVRKRGAKEVEHLYLFRPGKQGDPITWQESGQSVQYERDFAPGVHFLARATLTKDGVLFHYEFDNHSDVAYDMATAITDPRLTSVFHDVRLERTYVHHINGFQLLAVETPARLTMPLKDWLPSRYMDSYAWPVPSNLVEHRDDGITYYNNSKPVDIPLIATLSEDRQWVVASFTRTTGNVWSNPDLTCQHVDQEKPLPAGGHAVLEVKILVVRDSLDHVLQKAQQQRKHLE